MKAIELLRTCGLTRRAVYSLERSRAQTMHEIMVPFLHPVSSIVDIGAGPCIVAELLLERGHRVVALDIRDSSFSETVKPVLYDGRRIPFGDQSFDVSLLLQVLHHTADAPALIGEAMRVIRTPTERTLNGGACLPGWI